MRTSVAATLDQPLLAAVRLGRLTLPNRVVMAPLTRARASNEDRTPTELHTAYYAQRASAGLIVTEGTWVSERAVGFLNVPGIHSDAQVAAWRRVTDVVHAVGGRIVQQLWHSGAASHPDHLGGALPAGPSAVNPHEQSFTAEGFKATPTPRAMTPADIADTVAEFRRAAANARRAGFDGVEIHALGSSLFPQFLNPRLNRRTDAYGGDPARRRRLLLEVVDAVAEAWDGQGPGVRLSPYWSAACFAPDPESLADYEALVVALNDHPVTYLHLRGRDLEAPGARPDTEAIARYRRLFDGPCIANLGFDRESGNAAVARGVADAVAYGTAFVANPDLVERFALGRELAAGDPTTYYAGGAEGYADYPASTTGTTTTRVTQN
ncbi:alkene reductase [Streptodolium elevatio]|uniref:Alkene reductase n=1 Tax=Streptodolium elevatio TaxID=3157996 RepID=A0ABV3DHX6_9ACTN